MEQEVIVHGNLVSLRRWKIFKAAAWVKKKKPDVSFLHLVIF